MCKAIKRIITKMKCHWYGHEYEERKEPFTTLSDGKKLFMLIYGDCIKCGKKR